MKQLCIAAATISTIAPVLAQADTPSSDALQEIVVTAERRVESLQDVPISISAFNAEELQRANITEAKNYLQLTPNVSYAQDGQTGNGSIRISIRGVSNVSLGERAVPNSIGYYIDESSVDTIATRPAGHLLRPQRHRWCAQHQHQPARQQVVRRSLRLRRQLRHHRRSPHRQCPGE